MTNLKLRSRWVTTAMLLIIGYQMVGCRVVGSNMVGDPATDGRETWMDPLDQLHHTVSYRDADDVSGDSTQKQTSRAISYTPSPAQRVTQLGRSAQDGLRSISWSTLAGMGRLGVAVIGGLPEAIIDGIFGAIFDAVFGNDRDEANDC